jgi:acetolactate synthase-1/2/3 large subunit
MNVVPTRDILFYMKVFELICDFIRKINSDFIFGVPGYANSSFFIGAEEAGLTPVITKHEANAAWMAYGYSLASGKVGICTGTAGPGSTNLLTAVAAAYSNSVPILVLTGQVETRFFGKGAFQESTGAGSRTVNVMEIFDSVTLLNRQCLTPDDVVDALECAMKFLFTGRKGPVHLNVPLDIQKLEVTRIPNLMWERFEPELSQEIVRSFEGNLARSHAPLLLFGRGCSASKEWLHKFVEKLGIPYCTTLQAKGLVSLQSPLDYGIIGVAGSPRANGYLEKHCDLVIAIGTSLNEFTTNGFWSEFTSDARPLIHVDIDKQELDKNYHATLKIEAEIEVFLRGIFFNTTLLSRNFETTPEHIDALNFSLMQPVLREFERDNLITPMDIMEILGEFSPENCLFVADSGNNAVWASHYLQTKKGQDFLLDINTGCMGGGVITAIGARLGAPHRKVICICGDGGFMMNGIDLTTASDLGLSVLWVVMNDGKLGMVAQGEMAKYGKVVGGKSFKHADIGQMAKAYGALSLHIETSQELIDSVVWACASDRGPVVLDVRFNDSYLPQVYARAKRAVQDEKIVDYLNKKESQQEDSH